MSTAELTAYATLGTAIATIGLLFVVAVQIRAAREEVRLDHTRRRAYATLDYYTKVIDEVHQDRILIMSKHGSQSIELADAKLYKKATTKTEGDLDLDHVAMGAAITRYLNALERLAVGANLDVFDELILHRIARYRFVRAYKQFEHFINETQAKVGGKRIYSELVHMAKKWDVPESEKGGQGAVPPIT